MIENNLPCIDIGANLTSSQFKGDVEQVIAESRTAGLDRVILTGSSVENSNRSVEICKRHPDFLHCTAGIHPHDAKEFDKEVTTDQLRQLYPLPKWSPLVSAGWITIGIFHRATNSESVLRLTWSWPRKLNSRCFFTSEMPMTIFWR